MSRRNAIILGLLLVVIAVEIVILAPQYLGLPPLNQESRVVGPPAPKLESDSSGQVMRGVYAVEAKPSGKEWELWAEKALNPKTEADWVIQQVRVRFYGSDGVTYLVTGEKGTVVPKVNDIRIDGNVETRSSNGYVFRSQSVSYKSKERLLNAPGRVTMTAPRPGGNSIEMELSGEGLAADLGTNSIRIQRSVRATKFVEGTGARPKRAIVSAESAEFSGRTQLAEFRGQVAIEYDEMRVTGPEAKFQYAGAGSLTQLLSVAVMGGAQMTGRDKVATSRQLEVRFDRDEVVFSGSPRVLQQGDELIGEEIVLRNGGRQVQVRNAQVRSESDSSQRDTRRSTNSSREPQAGSR